MNFILTPEEASESMNRQANAMRDMMENTFPAIVECDPREAYRRFNFDLCKRFMENLETWANEAEES